MVELPEMVQSVTNRSPPPTWSGERMLLPPTSMMPAPNLAELFVEGTAVEDEYAPVVEDAAAAGLAPVETSGDVEVVKVVTLSRSARKTRLAWFAANRDAGRAAVDES